jgi:hypothetical protein
MISTSFHPQTSCTIHVNGSASRVAAQAHRLDAAYDSTVARVRPAARESGRRLGHQRGYCAYTQVRRRAQVPWHCLRDVEH